MCVCLSRPLLHVSVPESTTLRSVLVRTTASRTGQDKKRHTHLSLSLSTHAVRVTTHPCTSCPSISSSCPPPSSPFNEPQPDNSRSFPVPSFAAPVQLDAFSACIHTASSTLH